MPEAGFPLPGLKVESPDPLVTAGDFFPDERCGGKPRQQAQASAAVNLSPPKGAGELLAIEHCGLRQDRNAKEVLGEVDLPSVESRGLQHPLRNVQALSAKTFYIIRDDGEISSHALPYPGGLCGDVQVVVVHHPGFDQLRAVDYIAKSEVEMAVHALQGGDHQPVRDCRHAEHQLADVDATCAID